MDEVGRLLPARETQLRFSESLGTGETPLLARAHFVAKLSHEIPKMH